MTQTISYFLRDHKAATAIEYALIEERQREREPVPARRKQKDDERSSS
jgi:hypothetical protein